MLQIKDIMTRILALLLTLGGAGRARRSFGVRSFGRLPQLPIPRHIGTLGALALLLSSAGYGAVLGGVAPEFGRSLARAANLSIREIHIEGQTRVSVQRLVAAVNAAAPGGVMTFKADDARQAVEAIGWIETAHVLKLYPGTVKVRVSEHTPFGLWQRGDQVSVIAYDGTVLADDIRDEYAGLPLFVGAGAHEHAAALKALLEPHRILADNLYAAVFVAGRRWDLILDNGLEVRLPALDPALALNRVEKLAQAVPLLTPKVAVVDLRLSDRIVMRRADGLPVGEPEEEAGT